MSLRFSIVMPTFNRREMLQKALASVRAQAWSDVEIIVVDGGSTDGTIEDIEAQSDIILMKGPDRGVYDAFNKGIARSTGDVVAVLNSDDCYEPGTLATVAAAFAANPEAHAVCGTAILMEGDRTIAVFDRESDKALTSPRTVLLGSCIPNARFFRREAMTQIGEFSLDYRIVADRDWLARWFEARLKTIAIPELVYRYYQHDGSLTFDAEGRRRGVIYNELLTLSRRWQTASTSTEMRNIAALLEGRCIARLAGQAALKGNFAEAARLLFTFGENISFQPAIKLFFAGFDKMQNAIARR